MALEIRHTYEVRTRAPPEAAWALLADVDRFTRALGLGIRYDEERRPGGTSIWRGTARRFGATLRWVERPFEWWQAPLGYAYTREFDGGPAERQLASLELVPEEGGTRIRYTLALVPRGVWAWPLLRGDERLVIRPRVERAMQAAARLLDGGTADYDLDPAELPDRTPQPLRSWVARIPAHARGRLQPLVAARALGLDVDRAIGAFLEGTREGAFALQWELLCPSCRQPREVRDAAPVGATPVHCGTCDIAYDGSFPDALAVTFRATDVVAPPSACVMSPGRTPHLLASGEVAPGATLRWNITLPPGAYRLAPDPRTGTASVEAREGHPADRVALDLTEEGLQPSILRAGPGRVRISVRNRTAATVRLALEARARPPDTLTAARLLEHPGARDLLPAAALGPGLVVEASRRAVLAIDLGSPVEPVRRALEGHRPLRLVASPGALVAVWPALEDALAAALDLDRFGAIALHVGPCTELRCVERVTLTGAAVDEALTTTRRLGTGRLVVCAGADPAEVDRALAAVGCWRGEAGAGWVAIVRPAREAPPPRAVAQVGRWTLGERLGRGGNAEVYSALDGEGREAAVKLLHPEVSHDPELAQRFRVEVHALAELDHPAVAALIDWGREGDRPWVAMQRLYGPDLREVLRTRALTPSEVCAMFPPVLGALRAAHALGVVHCDVKPANLVLAEGRLRLVDFGIAHLDDGTGPSASRRKVGTPRYMAPEQVRGEPLDPRTDLYAIGLVLYEALSRVGPFPAPRPMDSAYLRLVQAPVPLLQVAPDVPVPLAELVMALLALEPGGRPGSADVVRAALEELAPDLVTGRPAPQRLPAER